MREQYRSIQEAERAAVQEAMETVLLQEELLREQEQAAIKIQSRIRGKRARKKYKERKKVPRPLLCY